jgi:radical SAM superfamily enzyme YgiQ (UPF0313 family)
MKRLNKIIFIQLPLITHDYDYSMGNIEYAAAAITGFIMNKITSNITITNLPFILTHFGSDSVIMKYILNVQPELVAFTCFLWNIERNLTIAQMIKEKNSDITIVFGGSEINFGSIAFIQKRDYVDYFVIGEGEWFFGCVLTGKDVYRYQTFENGNRIIIQPVNELTPAAELFEPFTGKRLEPMVDGSMFFELTRGCPYKCSYCLYSKNYNTIREIPFDHLLHALADKDLTKNLKDMYILSPAFNAMRDFRQKLITLSKIGHGIKLHSEMRGEGINAEKAELLYKAGFRSMEVGLQTLNCDSLKIIGRKSNPEKELEGIQFLIKAGIDVKIGIIPGLPHDTHDQFIDMIDNLVSMGFKDNIELYPLMILPGTVIRDIALKTEINFNKKPPYYYNYGWGITYDEIIDITTYAENATGYSPVVGRLPDFTQNMDGSYIKGIYFNGDDIKKWDIDLYKEFIDTNVFSFFINLTYSEILYKGIHKLLHRLPKSELFNVIIFSDIIINEQHILEINSLIYVDHLIQRMNIFHELHDRLKVKCYQVFNNYDNYKTAKEKYLIFIPLVVLCENNVTILSSLSQDDNVLISRGTFRQFENYIISLFSQTPEAVAFEDELEQEEFYQMIGHEYSKIPFQSKIVKT